MNYAVLSAQILLAMISAMGLLVIILRVCELRKKKGSVPDEKENC